MSFRKRERARFYDGVSRRAATTRDEFAGARAILVTAALAGFYERLGHRRLGGFTQNR